MDWVMQLHPLATSTDDSGPRTSDHLIVKRRRNHFTTAPRHISVSVNHCWDFSDELDCNPDHPSSYRCADSDVSDVFVPVEKLCDGKRDCPYVYLDEFRCKLCLPHEIECEDGNGCIPMGGGGAL